MAVFTHQQLAGHQPSLSAGDEVCSTAAVTYEQRSPGHYAAQTQRGEVAIDRDKGKWVVTWPVAYCNQRRTFATLKAAKADISTALASHPQPFHARPGAFPDTAEDLVAFLRASDALRNPPPDRASRSTRRSWLGSWRRTKRLANA